MDVFTCLGPLDAVATPGVCKGLKIPPLDEQRSLDSGVVVPEIDLSSGYKVLPSGGQRLGEVDPGRSFQRAQPLSSIWMPGLDCSMKALLMRSPLYIFQACGNLRDEFPVRGGIANLC